MLKSLVRANILRNYNKINMQVNLKGIKNFAIRDAFKVPRTVTSEKIIRSPFCPATDTVNSK